MFLPFVIPMRKVPIRLLIGDLPKIKDEVKLVVLVEKDEALLNFISLIPVNPKKFPRVKLCRHYDLCQVVDLSGKGQKIIRDLVKTNMEVPFYPIQGIGEPSQGSKN